MEFKYYQQNKDGTLSPVKQYVATHVMMPLSDLERFQGIEIKSANLERICRERANSERGLRPKKEHSGYVVKNSEQRIYHRQYYTDVYWNTTVQMPYNINVSGEAVEKDIQRDLHVLSNGLGIDSIQLIMQFGDYVPVSEEKQNVLFFYTLSANYREGYWYIHIWHTRPLKKISEIFLK